MRRTLMLLALLVAGIGGDGVAAPAVAVVGHHEISAGDVLGPAAFARSASQGHGSIRLDGSGPAPRLSSLRSDLPEILDRRPLRLASRNAAFEARVRTYRQYANLLARARTALVSSPTTAPPPFLLI